MTSFIIKAHVNRDPAPQWRPRMNSCPFCRIANEEAPAHKFYETDKVIAILDVLPLRHGHVLVIPKAHYANLSDLPEDIAGALGQAVTRVARALTKALENNALNVVCNQEYAQAVPHVHYHIIPAPTFNDSSKVSALPVSEERSAPLTKSEMHQKEFEAREELDDDTAVALLERLKARL